MRHSIFLCTDGSIWAVTIRSIMMIMATVLRGPKIIAKTGAMSIPEPTPTNPRISPAKAVIARAIDVSVVNIVDSVR